MSQRSSGSPEPGNDEWPDDLWPDDDDRHGTAGAPGRPLRPAILAVIALVAALAGAGIALAVRDLSAPSHNAAAARSRMRYARFRKLGMFIGSGAIEGGIKAIVVQRAKQAGMHWSVEGAADIIALRCQHASGRWDELWPAGDTTPAQLRGAV